MGPIEAFTTGWRKSFNYGGKATRSEYWWFYLFFLIVSLITHLIDLNLFKSPTGFGPTSIIFLLIFTIPMIAVTTRRLHDTGRSGWWQLIYLTVIGVIPLIIWLASESTQKTITRKVIKTNKSESDTSTKLRELNQLYKEGVLTKKEFTDAKKKHLT